MKCPKCGSTNCQMTVTNNTKVHTKSNGYGFLRGCCGYSLVGPVGLLCGFCRSGKSHSWTESTQKELWVCQECGARFTASDAANSTVVPAKFYCDNANNYIEYKENILVKKFVKSYAENWSSSLLGNDLVIRKTENVRFENHKNSCEAGWFENIPIIFALEEQTGVILTTQSLIIETVCLPMTSIKHIAIQGNTIYVESFCIRFASLQKAELFYQLLQELFEHIKIDYNRFGEYADLLMFLQSLPKSQLINQAVHFSSQEEYARFVRDLTKKGMETFSQQYPKHYECYIQAQRDKEKLGNPAILVAIIQLAVIFLLHMVYRGFLNAVLVTVLWGLLLFVVLAIYITALDSGFKKKIKEYIPKELNLLIDENESSNIAKMGTIYAADTEVYIRLDGVSELKDNPVNASIKKKSVILYIVLAGMFIIISYFDLLKLTEPKKSEGSFVSVQVPETDIGSVESAETTIVNDSLEAYLSEGIQVNGEATINSSEVRRMVDQDFLNACKLYTSEQIDSDATLVGMPTYGFGQILYKEFANEMDTSMGYSYVVDAGIENQPSFIITTNENFNVDDTLVVWGFIGEQLVGSSGRCYMDTYGAVQYIPGKTSGQKGSDLPSDTSKDLQEQTTEYYDAESAALEGDARYGYILEDSDSQYLTPDELTNISKEELKLARNEIYARHGRKFKTEDLNQYFSNQSWYSGYLSAEEFDESVLNEYEKANLDLIKSVENGDAGNDLPEYITGSQNQLGEADIINNLYNAISGNIEMEIGEYSGTGETYVKFSQNDEFLWVGTSNRYQTLPNGGIGIVFTGNNYVTGESDYLEIEWTTYKDKKSPIVMYDFDTLGLNGSYSFQEALHGN